LLPHNQNLASVANIIVLNVYFTGESAPLYAQYYVNHTETDQLKILINPTILEDNAELVDAINNTQMSTVIHDKFQSKTGYGKLRFA